MGEARNRRVGSRGYVSRRRYPGAVRSPVKSTRRPNIGILAGTVAVVITICVCAAFLFKHAADTTSPGGSATPDPQGILDDDRFYDGVFVDGISLGGLSKDSARARIEENQAAAAEDTAVTVVGLDGSQNRFPLSGLPEGDYAFDTDAVLDEAWNTGREGTDDERLAYIAQLPENPVELKTSVKSADPSSLEQTVRSLTLPYYLAPTDAAYDPTVPYDTTKEGVERLAFRPAVDGRQVNADALWEAVKGEFISLTFGTVEMTPEPAPPAVTADDIKADMQLMHWENIPAYDSDTYFRTIINKANKGHTFTTRLKSTSEARRTNITNANNTVSGLLLPGEIFDFNLRTGIRDAAHGYVKAPVDIGGKEDLGLGGGICQVSSTLYNAVIRYGGKYETKANLLATKDQPGLAVVERDNHSVPSGYVMHGADATVDMILPSGQSRKNLRFRNDFDKPVLIVLYLERMKIGKYSYWFEHCDIYTARPCPAALLTISWGGTNGRYRAT